MSLVSSSSIPGQTAAAGAVRPPMLYFAALAAVWLVVSWRLSYVWETSDQYSHGWFIPLFAAWVFWNRWSSRPEPGDCTQAGLRAAWIALALAFPVAGVANLVLESSPDWRMMMWLLAGSAFVASLALTGAAGGRPWLGQFAFVFIFALVAVPWPYDFETWLTVELSMVAARITTALLNFLGILAVCQGNTIEVSAGTLGVEDACSGVRSFQSSLMVALLLGEWFMLRAGWRVALCALGLVLAYALNIARMLALSLAVEAGGMDAVSRWHDPAGFVILFATLGLLWGICLLVTQIPGAARTPALESVRAMPGSRALRLASAATMAGLLVLVAVAEGWYRMHESSQAPVLRWGVVDARGDESLVDSPLGEHIQRSLGYDAGFRRSWKEATMTWEMIYMRWEPGRKAATAGPHAPDYCQKALGREVESKSTLRSAKVGDIELPYQLYTIKDGSREMHLAFILDDGRREGDWMTAGLMGEGSSRARRLQKVREGYRNTGLSAIQLAVVGEKDASVAEHRILEMLNRLVVPQAK